jgi:hypothetical protein
VNVDAPDSEQLGCAAVQRGRGVGSGFSRELEAIEDNRAVVIDAHERARAADGRRRRSGPRANDRNVFAHHDRIVRHRARGDLDARLAAERRESLGDLTHAVLSGARMSAHATAVLVVDVNRVVRVAGVAPSVSRCTARAGATTGGGGPRHPSGARAYRSADASAATGAARGRAPARASAACCITIARRSGTRDATRAIAPARTSRAPAPGCPARTRAAFSAGRAGGSGIAARRSVAATRTDAAGTADGAGAGRSRGSAAATRGFADGRTVASAEHEQQRGEQEPSTFHRRTDAQIRAHEVERPKSG